ncbi:MAG: hypothetical protein JXR91_01225, partial [Deltaproteobacteria bacterium]|nr:hypothetical protein [Deltaproteobacteria bacterium]
EVKNMLAETMSTWFKEAEDKGREEGREEGIKQGREEGREEGIEKEKINAAITMKKDGLSYEIISKYTGLTINQIEKL